MEILNDIFRIEVINKIRLYHSHPVADMIRVKVDDYECVSSESDSRTLSFAEGYFETLAFLRDKAKMMSSCDTYFDYFAAIYMAFGGKIAEIEARGIELTDRDIKFLQRQIGNMYEETRK